MNPKELQEQTAITKEMMQKAQQVCAKLHQSVNEQLIKSDVSDGFFKDPQSAILEEQVIKEAPQHFIALAAFISQGFEGLQNAILILNAKIDAISAALSETVSYMSKANDSTLSLIKAVTSETPVNQFAATMPLTREQLLEKARKKTGLEGYSRQQISDALFSLIKENQAETKDITKFEQSGTISPNLIEPIINEIKKINS